MFLSAADLLFGQNNEKPMFNDRKQIKSWIQNRLLPLGILIVIERSDDTKIVFKCKSYRYSSSFKKVRQKRISKKQKLLLQKQGLLDTFELQQKMKQKKMKESNCACPFRIRANYSIRSNKWSIVIVNGQHNHPLKNCHSEKGEFFNSESFNHDIHANFVKNRLQTDIVEPEMVEEVDEENVLFCSCVNNHQNCSLSKISLENYENTDKLSNNSLNAVNNHQNSSLSKFWLENTENTEKLSNNSLNAVNNYQNCSLSKLSLENTEKLTNSSSNASNNHQNSFSSKMSLENYENTDKLSNNSLNASNNHQNSSLSKLSSKNTDKLSNSISISSLDTCPSTASLDTCPSSPSLVNNVLNCDLNDHYSLSSNIHRDSNDYHSLSSKISSLSSENSMEDFLNIHYPNVMDGSNTHFNSLNISNSNTTVYESPFFEPVHDDTTAIPNVDDLIDDLFSKKTPQLNNTQTNRPPNLARSQSFGSTTQTLWGPNNNQWMLANIMEIDNQIPDKNTNDYYQLFNKDALNNQQSAVYNQNAQISYPAELNIKNNNSTPPTATTATTATTYNNNSNEDYSNIPITTFINDCPALY